VPDWYRAILGDESKKLPIEKWRTDPEDPRYALHFGKMVRALGARYDGHPDLESIDLAIVGAWGEGAGSADLTQKNHLTRLGQRQIGKDHSLTFTALLLPS
jgi:hypothetical protein